MKGNFLLPAVVVVGIVIVASALFLGLPNMPPVRPEGLLKFSSCEEIKTYMESNVGSGWGYYGAELMTTRAGIADVGAAAPKAAGAEEVSRAEDYSATNIQVEGVDEADIVKNDGKYIYVLSGNNLSIVDAYPAEQASLLSVINFDSSPYEMFVNGDRLLVFEYEYSYSEDPEPLPMVESIGVVVPRYYFGMTSIKVYDITDRSEPVLARNLSIEGSYVDSRMIGDYVYFVLHKPINYDLIEPPIIRSEGVESRVCGCADVHYFPVPDTSFRFTTIGSLNINDDGGDIESKVFLTGYSQNIYVSRDNIYVTYINRPSYYYIMERMVDEVFVPVLPADRLAEIQKIKDSDFSASLKAMGIMEVVQKYVMSLSEEERKNLQESLSEKTQDFYIKIQKEFEKTSIHRISIQEGGIEYKSSGDVPGNVLNQFSMDEYQEHFRIATTTGQVSRTLEGASSLNHIYVLDMDLNIVGKIEDLAPGEQIYSARFIGDRGYLVTFRKIDPLFVVDLSDPANPTLLGKLKIPGYSDYLHPYDENHIIGIGKETVEAEEGDFSWYQGVKLSLFDVTDVENPKELSKYVIGDRGTDSYALHDHKAFLFSRSKNLLVIPILLAEIDPEKYEGEIPKNAYGEYVWQGAYVFGLDLENGFVLKGRVAHVQDDSFEKSGFYWYSPYSVKRSLWMENVLYTISDGAIKANSLEDLSEINFIELPYETGYDYSIREEMV